MTAGKVDLAELDEMLRALRAEAKALGIARATADRIDAMGTVIRNVDVARGVNARRQARGDAMDSGVVFDVNARRQARGDATVEPSPGGSP